MKSTFLTFILVLTPWLSSCSALSHHGAAPTHEWVKVAYIIDGDTIAVRRSGPPEHLRLIGIDAPESRDNKKARRDSRRQHWKLSPLLAAGKLATEHMKILVHKGDRVELEFDVDRRDKYGRLLAYVFSHTGVFVNEQMVRDGYAVPLTILPNTKYRERIARAGRGR